MVKDIGMSIGKRLNNLFGYNQSAEYEGGDDDYNRPSATPARRPKNLRKGSKLGDKLKEGLMKMVDDRLNSKLRNT
jgi:hypothetical protein